MRRKIKNEQFYGQSIYFRYGRHNRGQYAFSRRGLGEIFRRNLTRNLKSAEKLAVEPNNCIVFEDAFKGFEAANAAGIKSVAITTVNKCEDLKNLPSVVAVIDDFTNLEPAELIEKHLPLKLEAI